MNYRELFNLGINIVGLIIFGILFAVSIYAGGVKKKTERLFSILIFSVNIYLIMNCVIYALRYYDSTNFTLAFLFNSLKIIAAYFVAIFFLLYCTHYFELPYKVRYVSFVSTVFIVAMIVLLVSLNPLYLYFFDFKIVHSGGVDSLKLVESDFYPFIHLFGFIVMLFCLGVAIFKKNNNASEKFSLLFFTIIPIVSLIFHAIFADYSIFTIGLIASFLFHFLFYYIQRGRIIAEQQRELSDQQIRIMISQIQPHFIYNCLSSISYLCTQDGKAAEKAIDDFSNYLRGNFSNINQTRIVPFTKELEHTQAYLRLEKIRFGDRVNIVYDIKNNEFTLPSLTLQPIVENAVKHGICKKVEGGTVVISTWDDDDNYYIRVKDDGVGFDPKAPIKEDDRAHVGLKNVSDRLTHMSFGKVDISSKVDVGTEVTITIPKSSKNKKASGGE